VTSLDAFRSVQDTLVLNNNIFTNLKLTAGQRGVSFFCWESVKLHGRCSFAGSRLGHSSCPRATILWPRIDKIHSIRWQGRGTRNLLRKCRDTSSRARLENLSSRIANSSARQPKKSDDRRFKSATDPRQCARGKIGDALAHAVIETPLAQTASGPRPRRYRL